MQEKLHSASFEKLARIYSDEEISTIVCAMRVFHDALLGDLERKELSAGRFMAQHTDEIAAYTMRLQSGEHEAKYQVDDGFEVNVIDAALLNFRRYVSGIRDGNTESAQQMINQYGDLDVIFAYDEIAQHLITPDPNSIGWVVDNPNE